MLGREILSREITAEETEIDLSGKPNGTYFFHLSTDSFNRVLKVIKE